MGTSWHGLCGKRCKLVPLSDTCLAGYELTSNGGTSWHHLWYELTSNSGTSCHEYELTWVRVDMDCVVKDVNSHHYLILALLGTSWHLMVVRVDIICGTSWHLIVVRVDMGTSWPGYELTWVRVDRYSLMQWLKLPAWKFGDRRVRAPLWPSSFKETKCFFPAHS